MPGAARGRLALALAACCALVGVARASCSLASPTCADGQYCDKGVIYDSCEACTAHCASCGSKSTPQSSRGSCTACFSGYSGSSCSSTCSSSNNCNGHGTAHGTTSGCSCSSCYSGYYGSSCSSSCSSSSRCNGRGSFSPCSSSGRCTCRSPYYGSTCSSTCGAHKRRVNNQCVCDDHYYGASCSTYCNCGSHGTCSSDGRTCICSANYYGSSPQDHPCATHCDSSTCGPHGKCGPSGKCVCDAHFSDDLSDSSRCRRVLPQPNPPHSVTHADMQCFWLTVLLHNVRSRCDATACPQMHAIVTRTSFGSDCLAVGRAVNNYCNDPCSVTCKNTSSPTLLVVDSYLLTDCL